MSRKIDNRVSAGQPVERPTPAISLRFEAWTAAELAMSLAAVVHRPAHRYLEAGASWRERAAAIEGFAPLIDRFGKEVWINILGLPLDEPDARTAEGLIAAIERLPAPDVLRYLVGYYRRVFRRQTPAAVMAAAVDGDRAARREFRRTSFADLPEWRDTLRHLLAAPAESVRDELVGLLRRWSDEVFAAQEPLLADIDARDVRSLRQATDGLPPEAIVERACPGITYVPEVGQTEVILVPTFALRPTYVILDHRTANLFVYPATTGRDTAGPPERLVLLGKAIGDETRLRIMRELTTGPVTPPELAARLGMPRTTLLHHLSLLRRANLIGLQVHDSAYHTYVLRDEHLDDVTRLLAQYLERGEPGRPTG